METYFRVRTKSRRWLLPLIIPLSYTVRQRYLPMHAPLF
jgi:hypothetical protein